MPYLLLAKSSTNVCSGQQIMSKTSYSRCQKKEETHVSGACHCSLLGGCKKTLEADDL